VRLSWQQITREDEMARGRSTQPTAVLAAASWLVVGGYGAREAAEAGGWLATYRLFAVALAVASVLTVAAVGSSTGRPARPRLHTAGLAVAGFGVVTTLVAWALPLWMVVLGAGIALIAAATTRRERAATIALAVAPFVGLATLIVAIEAEIGSRDEYGDYPAAIGIALVVTAVGMIGALLAFARRVPAIPADADAPRSIAVDGFAR
jgi:hypothetical protein